MTVLYKSWICRGVNFVQNVEYFGLKMIVLDTRRNAMPEISKHSLLEYYSFTKLFRSRLISLFDSLELTFSYIFRLASSLVNLALSSSKLFIKSFRIDVICIYSSMVNVPGLLYLVSSKMIWYDPYSCLNLIITCSNFNDWIL